MRAVRISRRFSATLIYFLRIILKSSVTRKFLTGDGFAQLAELEFFPKDQSEFRLRNGCSLQGASVVFCPGHKVEEMLDKYGSRINPRVLIIGNSDRDFYAFPQNVPKSIKRIYLQNSFISNDFFRTLPIGLENIRIGRNGLPFLFTRLLLHIPKKNMVLIGPFSPTHAEREELNKLNCLGIKLLRKRISPVRTAYYQARHRFVAVPRGNGVDTHRLWESLYRGSIPIVLENEWSGSLVKLGLPILMIQEWSNDSLLDAMKSCSFETFDPRDLDALWFDFWRKEFMHLASK